MKMRSILLIVLFAAGCAQQSDNAAFSGGAAAPMAADVIGEEVSQSESSASEAVSPQPSGPMLAYRYQYGISLAPERLRATLAQHEAQCVAAGTAQCQVIESSVSEQQERWITGSLNIRATPAWLSGLRDRLSADAANAGGRLFQSSVQSEDLSRQIVDTEAQLRAKTTLRDRLQQLLATRPGNLSDLLEAERALAQVQGELDATQSVLAMMRARVAMSVVTIRYESVATMSQPSVWRPIQEAFSDTAAVFVDSLAMLMRAVVFLAPWVLVGWIVFRVARRFGWFRRRQRTPPQ
ncbi:MAG: DUF4349 domain-containing protein [Nevskiaceae bacterium]|jgi:hypothetical protein|nr:DUF4349 domain-containing protein [Nevskiaceae bacterium]